MVLPWISFNIMDNPAFDISSEKEAKSRKKKLYKIIF